VVLENDGIFQIWFICENERTMHRIIDYASIGKSQLVAAPGFLTVLNLVNEAWV